MAAADPPGATPVAEPFAFAQIMRRLSRPRSSAQRRQGARDGAAAVKPVLPKVSTKTWEEDVDLDHGADNPQSYRGLKLFWLSFQVLGVVFGDLGTSPLYVFASVFEQSPSEADVVGAVSLICWTLTALLVCKYALIVLRADDHGNGGAFALYSLLKRAGDFRTFGPAHESDREITSYNALHPVGMAAQGEGEDNAKAEVTWRLKLARNVTYQRVLRVLIVFGVGALMGDGVLTPAISVVSAMEGVQISFPAVTRGVIVGVSLAIIAALFLIQQFGTKLVGKVFSPVIFIWLIFNAVVGVFNIAKHNPSILRALGPNYWFAYFIRNGHQGWRSLGGIVLCVTGTEALFADLGHFSRTSIQLSTLCLVWPSLILTYLGQAAYLTRFPDDYSLAYFRSVPHSVYWLAFVVAILAAIIASQALISAVFSVVYQAIAQSFFPRFHVVHTSDHVVGQVYIPFINFLLMGLCLIVVGTFKTSAKMGQAYGLAVTWDMLLTSHLLTLVMITVWKLPWPVAAGFYLIFATIEGLYFSAAALKVPTGGWFSIMLAIIYASIMLLWFWGSMRKNQFFVKHFYASIRALPQLLSMQPQPSAEAGAAAKEEREAEQPLLVVPTQQKVATVPGVALWYSETIYGLPPVLIEHLLTFPTTHKVNVIMTLRPVPVPTVLVQERFLIEHLGLPGWFHCIVRYGYTERPVQDRAFVDELLQHMVELLYENLNIYMNQSDEIKRLSSIAASAYTAESSAAGISTIPAAAAEDLPAAGPAAELEAQPRSTSVRFRGRPEVHVISMGDPAAARPATVPVSPFLDPAEQEAGASVGQAGPVGRQRPTLAEAAQSQGLDMRFSLGRLSVASAGTGSVGPSIHYVSMDAALRKQLSVVGLAIAEGKLNALQTIEGSAVQRARIVAAEIERLKANKSGAVRYIVGRAQPKMSKHSNWFRQVFLELPYMTLVNNTKADAAAAFQIPDEHLHIVGLNYII